MNAATVTISRAKWDQLAHDIYRGIHLVEQLRAAGVPVVGAVWPSTVEHGCLVHHFTPEELTWNWTA